MIKQLTTAEAAARLGVTPVRVWQLINEGRLRAQKHGRDWQIRPKDLESIEERPIGRPPKGNGKVKRRD